METTIITISLIIALGAFTQGLTGFGLALVSVPLLSLTIDAKMAVPIAAIFGWLVTFPIVWKMRAHIQVKAGLILFLGSIPASFFGAKLLSNLPSSYILIAMGVVLIASSIYSMRVSTPLFTKFSTPAALGAGFCSGILGASVGEPGPPAIAYFSMQPWTADQTKSTLVFFFMLQMVGAIASFWNEGLINQEVTDHIITAMPGFVIGMTGGMVGYHLLQKYNINYHRLIHSMLLVVGCILVLKNITF
jgi:uncharacterized membrane protein YfcA